MPAQRFLEGSTIGLVPVSLNTEIRSMLVVVRELLGIDGNCARHFRLPRQLLRQLHRRRRRQMRLAPLGRWLECRLARRRFVQRPMRRTGFRGRRRRGPAPGQMQIHTRARPQVSASSRQYHNAFAAEVARGPAVVQFG